MAQAKKVKPGQVWTAKVSGKDTQVKVVGEHGTTDSGRKKFEFQNLATGRISKGTAGKLKNLVEEAPPPEQPALSTAAIPTAPAPIRSAPNAPFQRRAPRPNTMPVAPLRPVRLNISHESLPSLRGTLGAIPGMKPPENRSANPIHYPSPIAESAAAALAASTASTPMEVIQVIQAWAWQHQQAMPPSMPFGMSNPFAPPPPRPAFPSFPPSFSPIQPPGFRPPGFSPRFR